MPRKSTNKSSQIPMHFPPGLRVIDPETARVVTFSSTATNMIIGAGCLVSADRILTCHHVIGAALGKTPAINDQVQARLVGLASTNNLVTAKIIKLGSDTIATDDLALLEIIDPLGLPIAPVEFCTPLRHGDKRFSVLGFPTDEQQGRNARGFLHAINADGLVQMDRNGSLKVERGYSGAPVWSPDLGAYVGLVVTELHQHDVSWCIPSRRLCEFHPDLLVRLRIPLMDRPPINDSAEDDPNPLIFGTRAEDGSRSLTAVVVEADGKDRRYGKFKATLTYTVTDPEKPPRGGFVTFVTYPGFGGEDEDAYLLYSKVDKSGLATTFFFPAESFTVAAVGDAGDTALTFDLATVWPKKARAY